MALAYHAVKLLAPHIKGAKVLSLGYPDILPTVEQVEELFGVKVTEQIKAGEQHNIMDRKLVETMDLFKMVGATLDCIDVVKWRGFERILDLNEPHDLGSYDLVIDPGTVEHCFNIGQAIMNAARAVKVGGRIYHSPPLFMVNHGFYNVCPTALYDFYTQNGWQIELFEARLVEKDFAVKITPQAASARTVTVAQETGLCFMAKRLTDAELRWPQQSKYVAMQRRKEAREKRAA